MFLKGLKFAFWVCLKERTRSVKARVVKIRKSMIAQIGSGFIVLVTGQILESCRVLVDDSNYLIVQFSQPLQ